MGADAEHVITLPKAAGDGDLSVRVWDLRTGADRIVFSTIAAAALRSLAVSPDKHVVAVGDNTGLITVIDLGSGKTRRFSGHAGAIRRLTFSPDGQLLASAGHDGSVRLWVVATGASQIVHRHQDIAMDVAFSPDGKQLVSTASDPMLWLGDVDASKCVSTEPSALRHTIADMTSAVVTNPNDPAVSD